RRPPAQSPSTERSAAREHTQVPDRLLLTMRFSRSLSHNVINAGSFSGPIVHPEYAPHGAERGGGGDGWERVRAEAHADELADPGRALVHRAHGAAGRGVA